MLKTKGVVEISKDTRMRRIFCEERRISSFLFSFLCARAAMFFGGGGEGASGRVAVDGS